MPWLPFSTILVLVSICPETEIQNGGIAMKKINLRDYYPSIYTSDSFIDVSDEVAAILQGFDRHETAYRMRTYRHRVCHTRFDGESRVV